MNLKKIKKDDDAVVGIVVTVLLIGLFLSIITMLNTVYVPQWLEDSEAAHMDEISNQFTQLKYALDIQSIVDDSTVISTPIKLGTREIPLFNRGRTFDTLDIINDAVIIDFDCWENAGETFKSDAIVFSSGNSYFIDQSYIYEAGALIVNQGENSIVYGIPSLFITNYINTNHTWPDIDGANLSFIIPQIDGTIGKMNVGGYGIYPIYTTHLQTKDSENITLLHVKSINITTQYPQAWKNILEQRIEPEDWIEYQIHPNPIEPGDNYVRIDFTNSTKIYNFNIDTKYINTQIAFGVGQ